MPHSDSEKSRSPTMDRRSPSPTAESAHSTQALKDIFESKHADTPTKELRRLAEEAGASKDAIENARDSFEPRTDLINLLWEHSQEAQVPPETQVPQEMADEETDVEVEQCRLSVEGWSAGQLKEKLMEELVEPLLIEEARDANDPVAALTKLLLDHVKKRKEVRGLTEALRAKPLRLLRKDAEECGADANDIEAARDADDPKTAMVELILTRKGYKQQDATPAIDSGFAEPPSAPQRSRERSRSRQSSRPQSSPSGQRQQRTYGNQSPMRQRTLPQAWNRQLVSDASGSALSSPHRVTGTPRSDASGFAISAADRGTRMNPIGRGSNPLPTTPQADAVYTFASGAHVGAGDWVLPLRVVLPCTFQDAEDISQSRPVGRVYCRYGSSNCIITTWKANSVTREAFSLNNDVLVRAPRDARKRRQQSRAPTPHAHYMNADQKAIFTAEWELYFTDDEGDTRRQCTVEILKPSIAKVPNGSDLEMPRLTELRNLPKDFAGSIFFNARLRVVKQDLTFEQNK